MPFGAGLRFEAVTSDAGAMVKRVLVLYTDAQNPGVWTPVELTSNDGTHFSGLGASTPSGQLTYIVQAVDAGGNVGIAMNKGEGNALTVQPVQPYFDSLPYAAFTIGDSGTFAVDASAQELSVVGTLPPESRSTRTHASSRAPRCQVAPAYTPFA